jgi:hypothetical protein
MTYVRRVLIVVAALGAEGCGGATGGGSTGLDGGNASDAEMDTEAGPDDGSDAADAGACTVTDSTLSGVCAAMACVECQKERECRPFGFGTTWDNVDRCISRKRVTCEKRLSAPGVSFSPERYKACAEDSAQLSCEAFLTRALPAQCGIPGGLATGSPCGTHAQCGSMYCAPAADGSACGTCQTPRTGMACTYTDYDCGPGLVCSTGSCKPYAHLGEACQFGIDCIPTLSCIAHVCAKAVAEGGACGGDGDCDALAGLVCSSTARTCYKRDIVTDSCGLGASACGPGLYCSVFDSPPGRCTPWVTDNSSCAADPVQTPPACVPGATCDATKVCRVTDPATCT